jgi:hypothetical protein
MEGDFIDFQGFAWVLIVDGLEIKKTGAELIDWRRLKRFPTFIPARDLEHWVLFLTALAQPCPQA